ncbi:MAG: M50 family metallopeptidase [Mycobacteriales bacterium]
MIFLLGVVLFAVGLGLSVAIHEFGHLLTAKAFGMKARRYFIGFGPKIWSFRRGETEYGLKAIPAGGFVDIAGFTSLDEVTPEERPRAFWQFAAWKRLIVLAAGSFTHFVIAFVLLYLAALTTGLPTDRAIASEVTKCVPQLDPATLAAKACTASDPAGPAYRAGIRKGDEITAINGAPVRTFQDVVEKLSGNPGERVVVTYTRDGQAHTTGMTVATVTRPVDVGGKGKKVGAIGVAAALMLREGPIAAAPVTGNFIGQLLTSTFHALGALPDKVPSVLRAIEGHKRDPNGPVSVVGVSRAGGQALQAGSWFFFLGLLAAFNVFIGLFNLLPLLPLDGGHVAILLFERARGRVAKLFGRADPGSVDLTKLMPVTVAVVVIFGAISVLTILADIVNPIANPFQ